MSDSECVGARDIIYLVGLGYLFRQCLLVRFRTSGYSSGILFVIKGMFGYDSTSGG